MSAFYIDLLGPLHWLSKQQSVTAGSSAEAEIYSTNKSVKFLLELVQILSSLELRISSSHLPTLFNDNQACVNWSKSSILRGLRRIQMQENQVRENIATNFVSIHHVDGKLNLANIITKEMKDTTHFVELRDLFMCPRYLS
jgi:hypothetical protein